MMPGVSASPLPVGVVRPVDVLAIARLFRHVREAGANAGQRVQAIQAWCGGTVGQSWCCYFATMVLDLYFGGASPIPRLGACQDVYDLAKKNGWITAVPVPGDLLLYVDANDHAHHIGFVTGTAPLTGIAGNTSEDGKSSNGTGVFEHGISWDPKGVVFVRYPR